LQNNEWNIVNLSTPESIMGLLRFRWKFDSLHNRTGGHILSSDCDLVNFNDDIICLYIDIDKLLERANLSEKQWQIISLYMDGYTEREIAYELNDDVRNIIGTINSVCKKICELNYESWKYDFIYWDKVKVRTNFKQCTKCKEYLPATREYFSPHEKGLYGLHPYCKKCRNLQ
jgi:hypothetical protein